MGEFVAVTEADLARARQDRAFKQALLATSLDQLLVALQRFRTSRPDPDPAATRQMREAVALSVELADRIRLLA
jgi:hypothetical protein